MLAQEWLQIKGVIKEESVDNENKIILVLFFTAVPPAGGDYWENLPGFLLPVPSSPCPTQKIPE